jgi:hypothetical protein
MAIPLEEMEIEMQIAPEITKENLVLLGNAWFDRLGETRERRAGLKTSVMPADIVARTRNDRLQTFLNHFFLQPDFSQTEYDQDPIGYIRSHSQQIISNLSRESASPNDHQPKVEQLSWEEASTIDQISEYLGVGVHTKGETPIMTIETALHTHTTNNQRPILTEFPF